MLVHQRVFGIVLCGLNTFELRVFGALGMLQLSIPGWKSLQVDVFNPFRSCSTVDLPGKHQWHERESYPQSLGCVFLRKRWIYPHENQMNTSKELCLNFEVWFDSSLKFEQWLFWIKCLNTNSSESTEIRYDIMRYNEYQQQKVTSET